MMTMLLAKLGLTTAKGFVTAKFRLVIEYAMIAVIVTLAGFTFTMWLHKNVIEANLVTAQNRLDKVEQVNRNQEKHIAQLNKLRDSDGKAFKALLLDYKVLAKRDSAARKRLDNLEKANAVVHTYLNTPVPDELRCMYEPCPPSGTRTD